MCLPDGWGLERLRALDRATQVNRALDERPVPPFVSLGHRRYRDPLLVQLGPRAFLSGWAQWQPDPEVR
jgi:hypothetical protein